MPDTRLLEEASEILFGDPKWHEVGNIDVDDEGAIYIHPFDHRDISFPALVRELSEVK